MPSFIQTVTKLRLESRLFFLPSYHDFSSAICGERFMAFPEKQVTLSPFFFLLIFPLFFFS